MKKIIFSLILIAGLFVLKASIEDQQFVQTEQSAAVAEATHTGLV